MATCLRIPSTQCPNAWLKTYKFPHLRNIFSNKFGKRDLNSSGILHTLLPTPFSCQETYQCLDVLSRLLRLLASHWGPHHWTNPADCPWHPWHQSLQCTHMPSSVQKSGHLKDVQKPPDCQIARFQQSQPPFFPSKQRTPPEKKGRKALLTQW